MNRFESVTGPLMWFMALLLSSLVAGCAGGGGGGGGGGQDGKVAPLVTAVAPFPTAIGVSINTKIITVAFTKPMNPATLTSTTITLACPVGTLIPGTVSYLASGNMAILALPASTSLPPNTVCTITVSAGVMDTEGNALESDFIISWTTASAAISTPPTVTGTLNANGATNVAINTKVGATFSGGMDPQSINNVNFNLKDTATGIAVPGTVSYSGLTALFIPLSNLAPGTHYTVTIEGGAGGVRDLAGNPLASDFVIGWTTASNADSGAPTVIGTVHASGETNVPLNTNAGATFSEGMDPLTMTNLNFTLKNTLTGAQVAGTVIYSGMNVEFMILKDNFGPPRFDNYAANTNYTATIKGGNGGVRDLAGNPMASDYVWNWTTGVDRDTTSPTVILVNPAELAQGVAIDSAVSATFSEAMDLLSISNITFSVAGVAGTVSYDAINRIATFTPTGNFASNTTYTATVTTGSSDLAGNWLAVDKVWNFTTAAIP